MSTRGAMGFRHDGKDHITYCHSDAYPEGLGANIVRFIRFTNDNGKWGDVKLMVSRLRPIVDGEKPTPEEEALCMELNIYRGDVGSNEDVWYRLLRNAQRDPYLALRAGRYKDYRKFLASSLWCEWAYIINLDEMVLEVYEGFQKSTVMQVAARGGKLGRYMEELEWEKDGYAPVALVATFPFSDIPDNWIEKVEKLESESES